MNVERMVDYLNEMLIIDKNAVGNLFRNRVQGNLGLQNHKTIRCDENGMVGLLGVINGMFAGYDYGPVAALVDDNTDEIIKFVVAKQRD